MFVQHCNWLFCMLLLQALRVALPANEPFGANA